MARTSAERHLAARSALEHDTDAWVATASASGRPHLVPLSFALGADDLGEVVIVATPHTTVTARNAGATGRARLGLGQLHDVVMVDATAEVLEWTSADPRLTERFVEARGWDPAGEPHRFAMLVLRLTRVQVWRDLEELAGRDVMHDGEWLTSSRDAGGD